MPRRKAAVALATAEAPAPAAIVVAPAPPVDALAVAALQREAEADALAIKGVVVATADDYTAADALLTRFVQKKDAAVAMRKSATSPHYAGIRVVEGWFRPLVDALETCEAHLKGQLSTYRVNQAAAEAKAREAAAQAAEAGDSAALLGALETATAVATKPAGTSVTVLRWVVDRVVAPDLVPREWWSVDEARLAAFAGAYKGDVAPVVPGVLFKREATVRASRKGGA